MSIIGFVMLCVLKFKEIKCVYLLYAYLLRHYPCLAFHFFFWLLPCNMTVWLRVPNEKDGMEHIKCSVWYSCLYKCDAIWCTYI